jgi:hypothetical protein
MAPLHSTYMVSTECHDDWNQRAGMSYDTYSSKDLKLYDPRKPEQWDLWWQAYASSMLADQHLLFSVEHGPPSADDIADLAADHIAKHGAPDDFELFTERKQAEAFADYQEKNTKAYNMLIKCVKLSPNTQVYTMVRDIFGPSRDAYELVKWLAGEASPQTELRQQKLKLANMQIERVALDPEEPDPFDTNTLTADQATSYVDNHWEIWSGLLEHAHTPHVKWMETSLRVFSRVSKMRVFVDDALLRLSKREKVFVDRHDYVRQLKKHAEFFLPARAASALPFTLRHMLGAPAPQDASSIDLHADDDEPPPLLAPDDASVLAFTPRSPARRPSSPHPSRSSPRIPFRRPPSNPRLPPSTTQRTPTGRIEVDMKPHRAAWCQRCHCQACPNPPDGPVAGCAVFGRAKPKPGTPESQMRYFDLCVEYVKQFPETTSLAGVRVKKQMLIGKLRQLAASIDDGYSDDGLSSDQDEAAQDEPPPQPAAQVAALIAQAGLTDMVASTPEMGAMLGITSHLTGLIADADRPPAVPADVSPPVLRGALGAMTSIATEVSGGHTGIAACTCARALHEKACTSCVRARPDASNEPSAASGRLGSSCTSFATAFSKNLSPGRALATAIFDSEEQHNLTLLAAAAEQASPTEHLLTTPTHITTMDSSVSSDLSVSSDTFELPNLAIERVCAASEGDAACDSAPLPDESIIGAAGRVLSRPRAPRARSPPSRSPQQRAREPSWLRDAAARLGIACCPTIELKMPEPIWYTSACHHAWLRDASACLAHAEHAADMSSGFDVSSSLRISSLDDEMPSSDLLIEDTTLPNLASTLGESCSVALPQRQLAAPTRDGPSLTCVHACTCPQVSATEAERVLDMRWTSVRPAAQEPKSPWTTHIRSHEDDSLDMPPACSCCHMMADAGVELHAIEADWAAADASDACSLAVAFLSKARNASESEAALRMLTGYIISGISRTDAIARLDAALRAIPELGSARALDSTIAEGCFGGELAGIFRDYARGMRICWSDHTKLASWLEAGITHPLARALLSRTICDDDAATALRTFTDNVPDRDLAFARLERQLLESTTLCSVEQIMDTIPAYVDLATLFALYARHVSARHAVAPEHNAQLRDLNAHASLHVMSAARRGLDNDKQDAAALQAQDDIRNGLRPSSERGSNPMETLERLRAPRTASQQKVPHADIMAALKTKLAARGIDSLERRSPSEDIFHHGAHVPAQTLDEWRHTFGKSPATDARFRNASVVDLRAVEAVTRWMTRFTAAGVEFRQCHLVPQIVSCIVSKAGGDQSSLGDQLRARCFPPYSIATDNLPLVPTAAAAVQART